MGTIQDKETGTVRDMTYGEDAVGLAFNPFGHPGIQLIKEQYAEIIDGLDDMRQGASDPEAKRYYSVAITEAQTSQMWAVKGIAKDRVE